MNRSVFMIRKNNKIPQKLQKLNIILVIKETKKKKITKRNWLLYLWPHSRQINLEKNLAKKKKSNNDITIALRTLETFIRLSTKVLGVIKSRVNVKNKFVNYRLTPFSLSTYTSTPTRPYYPEKTLGFFRHFTIFQDPEDS